MEVTVLGSAGWLPHKSRMTTCLAVRTEEALFVFDAGTGISSLAFEPYRRLVPPADVPVHLFLTHYHLDHVVGLTYLAALWSNHTVIHLPPQEITGQGPDVFDRLFGGPFNSRPIGEILPDVSLVMAPLGSSRVAGSTVTIQAQDHPGGSAGYRLDDLLAFVTDCRPGADTPKIGQGVRLLVNEAWSSERDDPGGLLAARDGHHSAKAAARNAAEAGVEELLLSHLPPRGDDYLECMLDDARSVFPRSDLCSDGMTRSL